jgi:hypothetical protein
MDRRVAGWKRRWTHCAEKLKAERFVASPVEKKETFMASRIHSTPGTSAALAIVVTPTIAQKQYGPGLPHRDQDRDHHAL